MRASAQLTATNPVAAEACYICIHPDATHDDIARRYCRATMTNALSRKCICSQSSTL